jgi:hypothetical protein
MSWPPANAAQVCDTLADPARDGLVVVVAGHGKALVQGGGPGASLGFGLSLGISSSLRSSKSLSKVPIVRRVDLEQLGVDFLYRAVEEHCGTARRGVHFPGEILDAVAGVGASRELARAWIIEYLGQRDVLEKELGVG